MVHSYSSFTNTQHAFVDNLSLTELDSLALRIPPLFFPNQPQFNQPNDNLYTHYAIEDIVEILYYGQISALGLYILFTLLQK